MHLPAPLLLPAAAGLLLPFLTSTIQTTTTKSDNNCGRRDLGILSHYDGILLKRQVQRQPGP